MDRSDTRPDAAARGTRVPVLVVDDEASIRKMLNTALEIEGYDVSTAADAQEASERLSDQHPLVAIVDINLPGINGIELCRRFVRDGSVEVILITGSEEKYSYDDAVSAGACDFLLKPVRIHELALRVERAVAARTVRMKQDQTVRELRHLSMTDGLTGLYNARQFLEQLRRELVRAGRYKHPVSLIVLDLDHFKQVNDRFGHREGDRVLRHVGNALRQTTREPDTAYRCGGEEFAVIVPETPLEGAVPLAQRILKTTVCQVNGPNGSTPMEVTASLGIAQWREGENARSLMHRADMAMYAAKDGGRNRIATADSTEVQEYARAVAEKELQRS